MDELFEAVDEVDCHLDDVGIFDKDWQSHLKTIDKVLGILSKNNFTVNPFKCGWGVKETDWLGHWLTPVGLKPWKKKVQAILNLKPPTNLREVQSFVGAVSWYRDMFRKRSEILAPLTELSKNKFEWTERQQNAFETMKAEVARDVLLRYPNPNLPYDLYVDASNFQLGAVIMQNGCPVAYFSKKLQKAQKNYHTMEKEMLSIVETLKTFRSMLYGCRLRIYTDHKNLCFRNLNSARVLRWRLLLEEYDCSFHYIKGSDNTIADGLSRAASGVEKESVVDDNDDETSLENAHSLLPTTDDPIYECPINYQNIFEHQQNDQLLQQRVGTPGLNVQAFGRDGTLLITVQTTRQEYPRIAIPTSLLKSIVNWYC